MKLERISSEQFAGVQDQSVSFADGMNVVLGDNESGKSTMISAMFHGLTTPVKLDKRRDKAFLNRCFPTGGADTIDVTVAFSQDGRQYQLQKVWDKTGEDTLVKLKGCSEGLLRNTGAEKKLRELLRHGPAIYDHLVFGRQDNEAQILDWCYAFFGSGGDADIEDAKKTVADAFSAAGGISADRFLKLLDEKLKDLSGHWDFDRDLPDKGRDIDNPWATGKGSILETYYDFRRAEKDCRDAEKLAEESRELREKLAALHEERTALEERRDTLLAQKGQIENRTKTGALLRRAEDALKKAESAEQRWPELEQSIQEGETLSAARDEAERRTRKAKLEQTLADACDLNREITELETALAGKESLPQDCQTARTLVERRERSRGRLAAARLRAEIALEPGITANIQTAEGNTEEVSGNAVLDANGFVSLCIPGVGTIRVVPQELDVDGLQEAISESDQELQELLDRHGVSNVEALQDLGEQRSQMVSRLDLLRQKLCTKLNGETLESLAAQAEEIVVNGSVEVPETLEADMNRYLRAAGQRTLEAAVAGANTTLAADRTDYGNLAALRATILNLRQEVSDYQEQLAAVGAASELDETAYAREVNTLKECLERNEHQRAEILQRQGSLTAQELPDLGELEAEIVRLKELWQAEKEKFRAYSKIRKDFLELQSATQDRMAGFTALFADHLSAIAGTSLTVDQGDGLRLCSGTNRLAAGELLSEGTRKTVLLAFRLAVLESFFPDGGGLVVLDDDLLDMDPARRTQAAKLLHRFAEKNQVIFTTCDPAIADLLGGNRVTV